jgi:proteasome lid subunit RPN8/RPN11
MAEVSGLTPSGGSLFQFHLPEDLWREMLAHVLACLPEEACGLVGSAGGENLDHASVAGAASADPTVAEVVLPIENELHSPVRFRMAPAEQLKAFYLLEDHQFELAAIFHSHPHGPHHPSASDLAEFAYPGVLMLIVSPLDPDSSPTAVSAENWQVRAYRMDGGMSTGLTASEVPLVRIPMSL